MLPSKAQETPGLHKNQTQSVTASGKKTANLWSASRETIPFENYNSKCQLCLRYYEVCTDD